MKEPNLRLGPDLVKLIAEIDEFKGRWEALKMLSPDRLSALRKVATIESVGSSTRIEGAKLSDVQVESLLSKIAIKFFKTRDEQEVAGYAETMDLVFEAFGDMRLTETHVRQLHQTLLRHSDKDERHRGSYKTLGQIADIVRAQFPKADIELGAGSDPVDDVQHEFDISAARRDFGYAPRYNLEQGIRDYASWLAARSSSK